jgi:HEPN domain-containing protein
MNDLVLEWIRKAEGDARVAEREAAVTSNPNYDAVCFHVQQAIEKYMKAILQEEEIPFQKTHDLGVLLDLLIGIHPDWDRYRKDLIWLSFFAVEIRYPGEEAVHEDAEKAIGILRRWRPMFEKALESSVQ